MTVEQGGFIKAVVNLTLPLETIAQNVFYFVLKGINPASDSAVLNRLVSGMDALYSTLGSRIASTVTLDAVTAHEWEYSEEEGWHTGRYIGTAGLSAVFTGDSQMLPHASAAIVTGYTANVKVRSRKSIAGLNEAQQSRSILEPAALTALAGLAGVWLAPWTIAGADHLQAGVPSKDGEFEELNAVSASDVVGSQRQRKPGVGA